MRRRLLMRDIDPQWLTGRWFSQTTEKWMPWHEPQPLRSDLGAEISKRATAARERDMESDCAFTRQRARGDLGKLREAVAAHSSHVWRRR